MQRGRHGSPRSARGCKIWGDGRPQHPNHYRATAGDPAGAHTFAAELVALKPDVIIVAAVSETLTTLQRETRTIPIVFTQIHDPVASGFVRAWRDRGQPNRISMFDATTGSKWLELLRQIAPGVTRAGIIYDRGRPRRRTFCPRSRLGRHRWACGCPTFPCAMALRSSVPSVIRGRSQRRPHRLPGSVIVIHRELIVALEARHRLPAIHALRYFVALGGLASYGVDNIDLYRRAASYVHRILKGEKPADLPVQAATKFELVINLTTAKALGLDVPHEIARPRRQGDRVSAE